MHFFRRAAANLGLDKRSITHELNQRQGANSTDSSVSSASPASRATGAAAASTASELSLTSSGAALSAASLATPLPNDSGYRTVTAYISTPAFTATKTTAYTAHGVNATDANNGTTTYTAALYLATANATAPGIPDNELTSCKINGTLPDNGPFCSPIHLQNLWVGYTYAVTWNPTLFPANGSDAIVVRYDDGTQDVVWNSSLLPNGKGYVNINMDKTWLLGQQGNDSRSGQNMTFYLQSDAQVESQNITKGPTISLVVDPSSLPRILIPKLPNRLGLEIGAPIGIFAALIIVLAIWCGMRKHDRSWGDIKGHGKDYMARRARRRGLSSKEGGIQLEDYGSSRGPDAFSDEPHLVGSGNAFRDEIAKQRGEDDRYRPTVYSY